MASSYRQAASEHVCDVVILTGSLEIGGVGGDRVTVELHADTIASRNESKVSTGHNGVPSRAELGGWCETQGCRSPSPSASCESLDRTVRIFAWRCILQNDHIQYGGLCSHRTRAFQAHSALIAQLVERVTSNDEVAGSTPS